jgi:tyrosine-protein kinase Etk/Wzc
LQSQFKGGLVVKAESTGSTLAHTQLVAENSVLGLDFLDKLIETYIERNFDESNLLADKTIEHIERQLGDISDDLTLSERQMQSLRLNRNVMNIDDKSANIYTQLQSFETGKAEVQRRLNHLTQMEDYFRQYKDSAGILAPSALGLNDPVLNSLINELTVLNSEKQRMISQDQTRNPRLATINIRINNLKDVISENLNFSLATTRSELDELNSRINNLNREFAILPDTQRELLDIERRFNLNDAVYTNLLERRIQAQIVKASNVPDAKIIEPPRSAGLASPIPTMVYALFLMIGIGLPSAVIVLKIIIVNRIDSKEDLKIITDIPIAGSIPNGSTAEKLILNYPKSPMAEAFYMLRSNIVYLFTR